MDDDLPPDMKADAERWKAVASSEMPADATLGADAAFLRAYGMPSAQWLKMVMLGELTDVSAEQLAAAKALLPYEHKQQASKVETTVTTDAGAMMLVQAIRSGMTRDEIVTLRDVVRDAAGITVKH